LSQRGIVTIPVVNG